MGLSNQNILLVLVIIFVILVALIFVVLTHKYEGGYKFGGRRKSHHDDDVDINDSVNDCPVCGKHGGCDCDTRSDSSVDINDVVESDTSSTYGGGITKLTFSPDLFEEVLKGKKTYDIRRKVGRFESLKSGDTVQLNRTKPDDESKYSNVKRTKAEILGVDTFDTFDKAIGDKLKEIYPSYKDNKEAKKEFEKFDKNPEAKFVLIHFKVKDVKKGGATLKEMFDNYED